MDYHGVCGRSVRFLAIHSLADFLPHEEQNLDLPVWKTFLELPQV
jgi:hypothetical protein